MSLAALDRVTCSPQSRKRTRSLHSDGLQAIAGDPSTSGAAARLETLGGSPGSKRVRLGAQRGSAGVVRLRALFPEMDAGVVARVHAQSGQDLDLAIRRLSAMRLQTLGSPRESTESPEPAAEAPPEPHPAASKPLEETTPESGEEWIDAVVGQMAAARDMADARARARTFLEAFERQCRSRCESEGSEAKAKLEHDNQILKRAVAIQHARANEMQANAEEAQHLRKMCAELQEQLKQAELNNYSLSMHLRQAIDHAPLPDHRHPDVL